MRIIIYITRIYIIQGVAYLLELYQYDDRVIVLAHTIV